MLRDDVLDKIYGNFRVKQIPLNYSAQVTIAIEEILNKIREEYPYATIDDLFTKQ